MNFQLKFGWVSTAQELIDAVAASRRPVLDAS
jgi:hypothetical protein